MKKLLYSILALIFISSTANANIYDDCEAAVSANDLVEVKRLAEAIKQSPKIPVSKLKTARLCVSTAAGEPMIFISATKSFISLVEYEALNAKKSLSDSEKIAEHRAQQREEQAKRTALKAMKEKAAKLRKQVSCMNIKSSEIITKVEAIEKQNQDTNNFLILQDTHKSCSILYGDNKSAAMLNQSCIDAFKSMGHPSLVLGEVERKSV
jgi:cell division protein FtsB